MTLRQEDEGRGAGAESKIDFDVWRANIRNHTFANYYLEMGVATMDEGALDVGSDHFRRALDFMPDLEEAGYWLGAILRRQGRGQDVEALRATPAQRRPDVAARAAAQATLRRIAKGAGDAGEHLQALAEAGAPAGVIEACRGLLHLSMEKFDDALACLPRVRLIADDDSDHARICADRIAEICAAAQQAAFLRNDDHAAWLVLKYADALDPAFCTPDRLKAFRSVCERLGRLDEALACARREIAATPFSAWTRIGAGVVLQAQGRWAAAERLFSQGVALAPDDPWTYFHAGILLQHEDRLTEAVSAYDRGLILAGNDFWGLQYKAVALDAAGRPADADACRRKADAAAPPSGPWVAYHRAVGLIRRDRRRDALETLKPALEQVRRLDNLNRSLFLLLQGAALRGEGRSREAVAMLEEAAALAPSLPWPSVNLTFALADAGDSAAAVAVGERLCARLPELGWSWLAYGRALAAAGRRQEAATACRRGIDRRPGVGWADFYLGGGAAAAQELAAARACAGDL
jgi:tetratricopeptide (TPR) repeat protein